MNRLIVLSNRVMLPSLSNKESAGGLGVAIEESLKKSGGIWFGWSGEVSKEKEIEPTILTENNIKYVTLSLSAENYENFYNGYSNASLWPLLHYRLDLVEYSRKKYLGYKKVNKIFADLINPFIIKDDIVWVQDYHFIRIAKELRKKKCTNKLGFFLHVPWPSKEVLMTLPDHREIVNALLDYDVIGFQTKSYVLSFLDYIVREMNGVVNSNGFVFANGKKLRVQHFPISIDTKKFVELSKNANDSTHVKRLVNSLGKSNLIIGVDRLDYSKGIINRFKAYESLLDKYPEHKRNSTLMQIAPTSRGEVWQYKEIRQELETEAGHINGIYSDFDWTPIRYLNRGFSRKILAGFFRRSQIGLVTPFRDGMNLVAKEYVAAQDPSNPGVLILSRFAGAAEELDGAIIINPYDIEAITEAINLGLNMSLDERLHRWFRMIEQINDADIHRWCQNSIKAIEKTMV